MSKEIEPHRVVDYADHEILEWTDTKVPTFLKWVYFILPFWGIAWFYLYWNGSTGWLDRGFWGELQKANNSTFPTSQQIAQIPSQPAETED